MESQHDASAEGRSPAPGQAAAHIVGLIRSLFAGVHRPVEPAGTSPTDSVTGSPKVEIGTADSLRELADGAPGRKEQEQRASHDQEGLADKRRIKELLQTHLEDAMWNELLSHIQPAAERGDHEFQLLRFPSDLCTDGGRKIRVGEEDWQDTLQGEAAELAAHWKRDLQPKGIALSARTVNYSNGVPDEIGLFVTWRG